MSSGGDDAAGAKIESGGAARGLEHGQPSAGDDSHARILLAPYTQRKLLSEGSAVQWRES